MILKSGTNQTVNLVKSILDWHKPNRKKWHSLNRYAWHRPTEITGTNRTEIPIRDLNSSQENLKIIFLKELNSLQNFVLKKHLKTGGSISAGMRMPKSNVHRGKSALRMIHLNPQRIS